MAFSIQGFKAVPAKFNEESSVIRWLFIKQHVVRDKIPEKPVDRTLFVINVPPFCDEETLKCTFNDCGEVDRVYCHASPNSFLPPKESYRFFPTLPKLKTYKVAYVVFKSHDDLLEALALDGKNPLILCGQGSPMNIGIEKWCKEYNNKIIKPHELQMEIDSFMESFDEQEKLKEQAAKKAGEEDEEGWITVTSKSRKRGIARTERVRNKILEKEKVKRSKKELKNFYTFQIRESKMKHLETLRRKFEEDKKKINAFKQNRKFKPF